MLFAGTQRITYCPAIMSIESERVYTWMREFPTPACVDRAVWSDRDKMQVCFRETPGHEQAAQRHSAGLYRSLGTDVFSTASVRPYLFIHMYIAV